MGYALVPEKFTFHIIPMRNWSSFSLNTPRHEGTIPMQLNDFIG